MTNNLVKMLYSSGKMWVIAIIAVVMVIPFKPTNVLAEESQETCLFSGFDQYLAIYYRKDVEKLAKVGELKQSQMVKAENSAEESEKTKVAVHPLEHTVAKAIDDIADSVKVAEEEKAERPDRIVQAVITAYTSTPDQTDDSPFIGASGKHVYDGMIAANGMPFGTKIKIPSLYGDKIFTVDDRMNKRYGFGRMDIWLDTTRAEARKFGVKRVEVEVYYPEKSPVKVTLAK